MRPKYRRFLSYVMLATYAGISFLGEGLHWLTPECDHHHHHGLCIVSFASEGTGHEDHNADLRGTSAGAVLTASDCDIDSHVCEICAFLYQAVSQPVEVASPVDWQPLVVAAPTTLQKLFYSPASLGLQAPRGPPLAA